MKKENVSAILYLISAVLFFISAIMAFCSKNTSNGVMNLALGSTFLCLAGVYAQKNQDAETQAGSDEESKETEETKESEEQ